jgi:hypothetical protein
MEVVELSRLAHVHSQLISKQVKQVKLLLLHLVQMRPMHQPASRVFLSK